MKTPSAESLLADIRGKCLECCGGSRILVDECAIKTCRLWKHRKGLAGEQTGMLSVQTLKGQMDMWGGAVNEQGRNHPDGNCDLRLRQVHHPMHDSLFA